jgi:hypothetical protein
MTALSLASLGDATQMKTILFLLHGPRKRRQGQPLSLSRAFLAQQFANVNTALVIVIFYPWNTQ